MEIKEIFQYKQNVVCDNGKFNTHGKNKSIFLKSAKIELSCDKKFLLPNGNSIGKKLKFYIFTFLPFSFSF